MIRCLQFQWSLLLRVREWRPLRFQTWCHAVCRSSLHPQDGGRMLFQNLCNNVPDYTEWHSRLSFLRSCSFTRDPACRRKVWHWMNKVPSSNWIPYTGWFTLSGYWISDCKTWNNVLMIRKIGRYGGNWVSDHLEILFLPRGETRRQEGPCSWIFQPSWQKGLQQIRSVATGGRKPI